MTPIHILLVEDNPGDATLTRLALEKGKIANCLHLVEDGVEAMSFLRNQGPYAESPRPDLILLDLNLPRKDGREVLAEVKADPDLAGIPVVVLTTSQSADDVLKSYELHANAYVTKPVELKQFMHAIRSIDDFWVCIVRRP